MAKNKVIVSSILSICVFFNSSKGLPPQAYAPASNTLAPRVTISAANGSDFLLEALRPIRDHSHETRPASSVSEGQGVENARQAQATAQALGFQNTPLTTTIEDSSQTAFLIGLQFISRGEFALVYSTTPQNPFQGETRWLDKNGGRIDIAALDAHIELINTINRENKGELQHPLHADKPIYTQLSSKLIQLMTKSFRIYDSAFIAEQRRISAHTPTIVFDLFKTLIYSYADTKPGALIYDKIAAELQQLKKTGARLILWTDAEKPLVAQFFLRYPEVAELFEFAITIEDFFLDQNKKLGAAELSKAFSGIVPPEHDIFSKKNFNYYKIVSLPFGNSATIVEDDKDVIEQAKKSPTGPFHVFIVPAADEMAGLADKILNSRLLYLKKLRLNTPEIARPEDELHQSI